MTPAVGLVFDISSMARLTCDDFSPTTEQTLFLTGDALLRGRAGSGGGVELICQAQNSDETQVGGLLWVTYLSVPDRESRSLCQNEEFAWPEIQDDRQPIERQEGD